MDLMGLPLWAWIIFYALVLLMLVADLKMFGRKGQHEVNVREALQMTAVWIGVSLVFCAGIYLFYPTPPSLSPQLWGNFRGDKAMEFLAGYLIEKSLSMDNLFVFLMLFSFFGIERKYQHDVLFWGIFGALVLRSVFIFAGAAMVERFEWVLGLFGLFLLYTGTKMFTHDENQQGNPGDNFIVRLFKRFFPVTDQLHGEKFFIREQVKVKNEKIATATKATPLFIALLVIETTDVAFAVDSIPAVFSVSRDPFIVLTSNIFAILGLRALYFALAAISRYFTYLKYGLGIILIFVGVKMLLSMNEYINDLGSLMGLSINMPHIEILTPISLAVIFGILMLSMLASVAVQRSKQS